MPKIVDHEKYRKEILEKCVDIFFARGYSALSLKELAAAMKVSVGSLYYYFPSKTVLFEAVYKMVSERSLRELGDALQSANSRPEKLRALVESTLNNSSFIQKQIVLSVDMMRSAVSARAERLNLDWMAGYSKLLTTHLEIKAEDAQLLITYMAGLVYSSYTAPNRKILKSGAEVFLDLLSLSAAFQ